MRSTFVVVLLALGACKSHEAPPAPATGSAAAAVASPDHVPRASRAIQIDGDWEEPDWSQRALRGQFRGDDGALARPSSEIRLLHDDHDLIIALYAADQNIETRDAFDVSVGPLSVRVAATGAMTPALPGVRAKVGFDEGTLDNPNDDDEEWVVELAIPLAQTGLAPGTFQEVRAARCDVPKDNVQRCGRWSGRVTLQ